jgi:CheY-like chemotaxis protein
MPTKGCPFPGSKELFEVCRAVADRARPGERVSDVELGRLVGFENARTSRWKHGRIEVADATRLLALSRALELDLAVLVEVAAGKLRAREALGLIDDPIRHLRFIADTVLPGQEGRSVRVTDASGRGFAVEVLGPHKVERREIVFGEGTAAAAPVLPRRRLALLADDDPEVVVIFLNAARDQPAVDPLVATSLPQALVLAGARRPDLVLLDLFLPGGDGFAALRALHQNAGTAGARLVATTYHPTPEIAERAKANGAQDVVARPLQVRYLTHALRALL